MEQYDIIRIVGEDEISELGTYIQPKADRVAKQASEDPKWLGYPVIVADTNQEEVLYHYGFVLGQKETKKAIEELVHTGASSWFSQRGRTIPKGWED